MRAGSRRRPSQDGKASLFPFLAVLLCTMGALIMLLVVIARNVREQSETVVLTAKTVQEESAEEEPANILEKLTAEDAAEILEQLQMGAEETDWFLENITEVKKEREKEIEEKKTRLALLEKETQRVHDEIERLAKLAEKLEGPEQNEAESLETLKKRLQQRQKDREQIELELAELQKEVEQDKKSYAIIPYRGKSGTFRRPIYVECRDDKVIIQPEGVELYPDDFQLLDRPDNPFDAVLRVIRQYYIETNQIVRGSEPYPLLIVRPSGVDTYKTTREAIGSWIKEYGYELVDEDWKIEYPQPSAELRERIEKQLETSRTRMMGYLAAMNAAGAAAGQRREQFKLDHRGQLQRADEFGQTMSPRFGGGGTAGGGGGGSARRSPGSGAAAGPGRGQGTGSGSAPPTPPPMLSRSGASGGGPDISLAPMPPQATGTNSANETMPESLRSELSGGGGQPSYQIGTGQPSGQTPYAAAPAQTAPTGKYAQPMPPGYADSGQYTAGQNAPNQATEQSQPGAASGWTAQKAAENQEVLGIVEPEPAARHSNQMPNILNRSATGQTTRGTPQGTQPGTAQGSTPGTAPGSAGASSPLVGTIEPGTQSAMSGMGAAGSAMQDPNVQAQNGQPAMSAPIVSKTDQRKENWALRGAQPFSAAISRPVKIQCDANKFVLLPQKGLIVPKVIPVTDSVTGATDKLVREIWEYMDTWGVAGEKTYWRPILEVTVSPGGEQRFQELKYLLRNSGLVIEQVK